MDNFDEDDKIFIQKLLTMSTEEIKAMIKHDNIVIKQLEAESITMLLENVRLTEKFKKVDEEVNYIHEKREKSVKKITKLEENKNEMENVLNNLDDKLIAVSENFKNIREKCKNVKKIFEEKCLDIRGLREEFKTQWNKINSQIKEAELELTHKKDSLTANLQVLESKIACLAKDESECAKLEMELKSLTDKNYKDILKDLEMKQEELKLEFSELNSKHAECSKEIEKLNDEIESVTALTEKLSLDLTVEEKCNQKLEMELKTELEILDQTALDMISSVANSIHCDNLELAKILRDDLMKCDQNKKEIEFLGKEKKEMELKNQEFDVLKAQKFDKLKELGEIKETKIESKKLAETDLNILKEMVDVYTKQEQALKAELAAKAAQSNVNESSPSRQLEKDKNVNSKPLNAKKSIYVQPSQDEKVPENSNEKIPEPNVFSSSSSDTNHSLDMSSSLTGSKPDIMHILANLSSNKFVTKRHSTGSTEK